MKLLTHFLLLSEFGTAHIPITEIGRKYFGYDDRKSKIEAAKGNYPFTVFRSGGQKSQWLVDVVDLAEYLDAVKASYKKQKRITERNND